MRLRLDLGYDGTEFSGWARQPDRRTVEQTLDDALARALRLTTAPGITVAGRTDAGVHARGQVAHTDVPVTAWDAISDRLLWRLRGLLPDDVRVSYVGPALAHFNARFAALSRRYAYRVSDEPSGADPLRRRDVLSHPRPLDVTLMKDAAIALQGEHDFASYCRRREGASTIRRLIEFGWERDASGLVVATVVADAFCHNMVRSLVGACLAVGEGRKPVSWPRDVLNEAARSSGVHVVPAHGLTLEEVVYPPDDQLAARVIRTRARRDAAPPDDPA